MLPLLSEPQALVPGHRGGGVRNAQDRDRLLVHAGMVPQRRAGRQNAVGRNTSANRMVMDALHEG